MLARWLVVLGVIVFGWATIGLPAHATYGARVTADEPQYLLTALSLGTDGDLDIADELADERYRPFHAVDIDPQTYPLDADGRQISPHDPLLPLLLALPMRFGGWVAAKAMLAGLAAVLAVVTAWTAVRRFGCRPRLAIAVVGAFACTAPLATYATQVYPEIPAALAVMVAVAALTGPLQRRGLVTLVVAIVALPWLSIKYAPVAACVAGIGLWRLRERSRTAFTVVTALAASALAYAIVHRVVYGGWTAYATGDHFADSGELTVVGSDPNYIGRSRRLAGLIVDDGFGLAAWMTGWLLLPFAVGSLLPRRHLHSVALVMPLAAGWFTATFVALTMHGWWWPGRQLVVVLPLGVIAIAIAAQRSVTVVRAIVASTVIGAVTWLWTMIDAANRGHVLVVDFDETTNPWIRLWRLALPDGRASTIADEMLLGAWTIGLLALVVMGWRRAPSMSKVALTSQSTRPDAL